MYSGEDSNSDALSNKNQFTSWPLSQSACNMNKDQIDWAVLAQQWIQMKESCSKNNAATAVPQMPINLPPATTAAVENFEEKGEAPMEVVRDDDLPSGQNSCNLNSSFTNSITRDWTSATAWLTPDQTQFCSNWNNWATNPNNSGIQMPSTVEPLNFFKGNTSNLPLIKNNVDSQPSELPPMDVAKKKTLPAWIREGLEKMEKEKQKQLERIKKENSNEPENEKNVPLENILHEIDESKNDLDSDNGGKIEEKKVQAISVVNKEKSEKTHEEIVEELMLVVRKSLTELLLEVTNEEIVSVAQESLRKYKTKASSAQVFRKSAISSITGKLGLGAYADSASENSDSESDSTNDENDSEDEIKEDIKMKQNAFKLVAQEIEKLSVLQFENRHQHQHHSHQQGDKGAGDFTKESTNNEGSTSQKLNQKDSGETQPDKKTQSNGKRSKERTSRFSAIKDSKQKTNSYVVQATAIPSSSSGSNYEYDKRKNKSSRRDSYSSDTSSDYYDSHKYSSSNNRRHRRSSNKDDKYRSRDYRGGGGGGGGGDSSRASSDSDDQHKRRKYRKTYSKDKSRSRSRSRSRSQHSYSSKRSEKRY